MAKFAYFWSKYFDVSRTKALCQVISFLHLLSIRYNCAKFHNCTICICVINFKKDGTRSFLPSPLPSVSIPKKVLCR